MNNNKTDIELNEERGNESNNRGADRIEDYLQGNRELINQSFEDRIG